MNTLIFDTLHRNTTRFRRKSLDDVLVHMQTIADSDYEGDLQAHALEIFRTLTDEEQRMILRRSLTLQWERMLEESKEELSRTSGFTAEEEQKYERLEPKREPDYEPKKAISPEEEEAARHADKVRGWKNLAVRALLICLIFALISMLISTIFLDKNSDSKGIFSLLDSFLGLLL